MVPGAESSGKKTATSKMSQVSDLLDCQIITEQRLFLAGLECLLKCIRTQLKKARRS
jgi:hypothetical protein